MERLTTKLDDGNYIPTATCTIARDGKVNDIDGCKEYCDSCDGDCFGCPIQKCFDKLGEYEDAEDKGLLLRLPCNVGDTVYTIRYGEENDYIVVETKIIEIRQNINGTFFEPLISRKAYKTEDFGKEVFITKEEAEQRLKEMSKHDGE